MNQWAALALLPFLVLGQASLEDGIQGYVVEDQSNAPVVGANILVVGTEVGTISDAEGRFNIPWEGPYPVTLRVTFIGYEPRERTLNGPHKLSIRLVETVLKGQEIIITGTRSAAARDVSSSLETVSTREAEGRGIRDVSEILQEMEAVTVHNSQSGRQTVSIRGSNPNEVAVYLDGIKLNRASDGVANLALVDLSELVRVDVVRGGTSLLFGPGNFGGVVLLHSRKPDRNNVYLLRSMGLNDQNDQDLSAAFSVRLGPLGAGGRYSGKSRLFDGRTLYTSLFTNFTARWERKSGEAALRRIELENFKEFPSGGILGADNLTVDRFSYAGRILGTRGWDIQLGRRSWNWEDRFFSSLNLSLVDSTTTVKLGKSFSWRGLQGTLQLEQESQSYSTDHDLFDSYSNANWGDQAELSQQDRGWAGVLRYVVKRPVQDVDLFRLELGTRRSLSDYQHDQWIDEFDSTALVEHIEYHFSSSTPLKTYRLGTYAEGHLQGGKFVLFFNQGFNYRLPTLNDRALWGTGLVQLKRYLEHLMGIWPGTPYQAELLQEKREAARNVLQVMESGLEKEYVTTAELKLRLIWDQLETVPVSRWELGLGFFRNAYLDKIVYRPIPNNLVAPYNTQTAWLNGLELGGRILAWNNLFQIHGNLARLFPSDAAVFPNIPATRINLVMDFRKGRWRLNLSRIYQGPQQYLRGGVGLQQLQDQSNTNLTVSYQHTVWRLNFTVSYTVRNLFSEQVTFVDSAHPYEGEFNYYDAHRQLVTVKVALAQNPVGADEKR